VKLFLRTRRFLPVFKFQCSCIQYTFIDSAVIKHIKVKSCVVVLCFDGITLAILTRVSH